MSHFICWNSKHEFLLRQHSGWDLSMFLTLGHEQPHILVHVSKLTFPNHFLRNYGKHVSQGP